jgi:hypothetical protein
MGVTPKPVSALCMMSTDWPATVMEPSRLEENGSDCEMLWAYQGAARQAAMMATRTRRASMAVASRVSLRRLKAQGPAWLAKDYCTQALSNSRWNWSLNV